jgi:hypothetical protein
MSISDRMGKNQSLWSHFGNTACQGNLTSLTCEMNDLSCAIDSLTMLLHKTLIIALIITTLEEFVSSGDRHVCAFGPRHPVCDMDISHNALDRVRVGHNPTRHPILVCRES